MLQLAAHAPCAAHAPAARSVVSPSTHQPSSLRYTSFKQRTSAPGVLRSECKNPRAPTSVRRLAVHAAAATTTPSRQLWEYDGSSVACSSLPELQMLHRRSFGHRNARTYLVVIVDHTVPACAAIEQQVERLASGTLHEPSLKVAALDLSADSAAAGFACKVLGVGRLPAALLYPEGVPGCLAYTGRSWTAEALLDAVNKARRRSVPSEPEYELIEAYVPPGLLQPAPAPASATAAAASLPAAQAFKGTDDVSPWEQLLQQQRPQVSVAPSPTVLQTAPLVTGSPGYWSRGKVAFWVVLVLLGCFGYWWDTQLSEAWEDWCLKRRQAARQQGRKFSVQENMDDLVALLLKQAASGVFRREAAAADGTPAGTPIGAFSSNTSGSSNSSSSGSSGSGTWRGPGATGSTSSSNRGNGGDGGPSGLGGQLPLTPRRGGPSSSSSSTEWQVVSVPSIDGSASSLQPQVSPSGATLVPVEVEVPQERKAL